MSKASKVPQVQQTLQQIRATMKTSLLEREHVIDGMLAALIAKEMLFVLGTPGTAKSMACEVLCEAIQGNYFSWLMGKFTTPEEIFGPYSLKGLQGDKYMRVTTGKLPDAHVAFLDEIFKGSSAILNTLLPVINERVFYNNGKNKIPLQVVFGASNEVPSAEELSALYDRFALRYVVEALKDEDNFRAMLSQAGQKPQMPQISIAELEVAQQAAMALTVPDVVFTKVIELRRAVNEKQIYVSDRKWNQAMKIVKAAAYLEGHTEVQVEDLVILENVLWHQPDQIPEIRNMVRTICKPILATLSKHVDAATEVIAQFRSNKIEGLEAYKKLMISKESLEALNEETPDAEIEQAIEFLGEHVFELSQSLFGSKKAKPKNK